MLNSLCNQKSCLCPKSTPMRGWVNIIQTTILNRKVSLGFGAIFMNNWKGANLVYLVFDRRLVNVMIM
jgi:hypothetical protein